MGARGKEQKTPADIEPTLDFSTIVPNWEMMNSECQRAIRQSISKFQEKNPKWEVVAFATYRPTQMDMFQCLRRNRIFDIDSKKLASDIMPIIDLIQKGAKGLYLMKINFKKQGFAIPSTIYGALGVRKKNMGST